MPGVRPPHQRDEPESRDRALHQAARLQLQPGLASLRPVRVFLRQACGGALSAERAHDAELLGTELVANALRHGAAPIWLDVDRRGDAVRIAVSDGGASRPQPSAAAPTDESGRGLALLRALSEQWGVTELDDGKSVWFTLADPT